MQGRADYLVRPIEAYACTCGCDEALDQMSYQTAGRHIEHGSSTCFCIVDAAFRCTWLSG